MAEPSSRSSATASLPGPSSQTAAELLACDAVVTEAPAPVGGGRVAVKWAGDARLPGSIPAVTGISVVRLDEQALRIGRLPVRSTRRRA